VILLTVDCLRADVFTEPGHRHAYYDRLKHDAVWFTEARTPGSATVPSLSAVFSGKYYSELLWKRRSKRGDVWPAEDPSVRFPELLQRASVRTVTVASKTWLMNEHGVVRGFDEQDDLDRKRTPRVNHVKIAKLLPKIEQQLTRHQKGPLFLYAHAMDPHWPYDSGRVKRGKLFDRYTSEIDKVGKQLARFDDWLRAQGLFDRTTLILSADHGEAFGEHGTTQHSKTLYDELIHVPLWIRVPGAKGRTVAAPVSLIDLGPTILDLFGLPTPASYQGQSLVGFPRGESPELTRPIAAEGRLLQMVLFPDGKKAIFDSRRGIAELYDLKRDPTEANNLAENGNGPELSLLRAFFDLHKHPSYGRHAPYRP
jgi:arylsulfatase A-like enzyme